MVDAKSTGEPADRSWIEHPLWRHIQDNLLAFVTWWLAALLVSLILPAMAESLPISPLWIANALAYGSVLARGIRLVPAFALAALAWNITRGDPLAGILVGTGTFLAVMLFVAGFSRWLERHIEQDHARRLLRVPIIAVVSASLFSLLGAWQFAQGLPDGELVLGLWLSEVISVLLFTPLARQWLQDREGPPCGQRRATRPALAGWGLVALVILAALWGYGDSGSVAHGWLPNLALTVPILAVYLLPVWLSRLVVPLFMLAWTAINLRLFTGADGFLDTAAMLDGQMVIFTATLIGFLAIEAVHAHEQANRRLDAARLHDGLTGLYNDLGITERLRHPTGNEASHHALIGIQVPDIDDLSTLTGLDEVHIIERRIADTLRSCVASREALGARLQPGLFALLVPVTPDSPEPATLANRLWEAFHHAGDTDWLPAARLGLRLALIERVDPVDSRHMTSLLLTACRQSDLRGHRRFYHHREAAELLIDAHREALRWARRLREALAGNALDGDFELFAQPILEHRHPEVHRAEVLIRWRQPDGRLLGPDDFLAVAETFGLMPRIDEWVLNHALALVGQHPGGRRLAEIAINLSGDSLEDPRLPETLAAALAYHGWPAGRLFLEITETMVIHETRVARENVRAIHDLGVRLAIDDFGTGRATFAYLKQYPVEELKIDGSFVRAITTSGFDREVVRTTCQIADFLGARVVAEFVETEAQMAVLAELGVGFLQGYGIARPMPLADYLEGLGKPPSPTSDGPDLPRPPA